MPPPAHNDAALVHASLAGDRGAFAQIVARYQSLVCSLAYSATGSLNRSEDLAQETFLAAWKQLPDLREPAKLRAWLCGIARHLISNAQRRAGREPAHLAEPFDAAHEAAAAEPSPPEQAVTREEEALLWHALEKIPDTYREPLVLFYREHKSVEAVARELELTEDAVKQRLSRGRALLHEQVLALVEGTLERSNPGRAFTRAVLSALPPAGAISAAAVATTAKTSATTKAASSASGTSLAAAVLGSLAAFGGYIGWQMGDLQAQTADERLWVVRFWRVVVSGFALFLLPAFVLVVWHRSHPSLQTFAIWWLGALYVAITVGFALYAWRQHRRIRSRQPAAELPAPVSRRRLVIWTAAGTLAMAALLAFCARDYGGWRTQWLTGVEARAFIATHPTAKYYVLEREDGRRSLSIVTDEGRSRTRYSARFDDETRAALQKIGAPVKTLVQGRDYEILGWPGRFLFVPALLIVAAGIVTLVRTWLGAKSESAAPSVR